MFKNKQKSEINFSNVLEAGEQAIQNFPPIKKRRKRNRFFKFIKYFSYFILLAFLALLIFSTVYLWQFKKVYDLALFGKENLEASVTQIKYSNFSKAINLADEAENNFRLVRVYLEEIKSKKLATNIDFVKYQINDLENLIATAEILSRGTKEASILGKEFFDSIDRGHDFNFSQFTTEEKRKILKLLHESGPELNGFKANLDLAYLNLKQVEANGLLLPFRGKINLFKEKILLGSELMSQVVPAAELMPILAGYPNKSNFLVILQNSDELRPTGGFVGTYGILELANGDILRFDTHDIYHMDMPVKDMINISPPIPIKKYLVDKWYMRDSNWSPDWPMSAQNIEWFYHLENKLLPPENQINNFSGEFDGVIGITPDFIKNLLELLGPVEIEGIEYSQDNFTNLLEYQVERGYAQLGVSKWQRKEVIGEIAKELKIRLLNLPMSEWPSLVDRLYNNIYKKNLLIYLQDDQLENLIIDLGWGGEVKETTGDYLMVVDANLAAFKTDAVMSRSLSYSLNKNRDGLVAKVRINYAHNGDFDWRTTRYQSYTRIYVPQGSELIKTKGFISDVDVDNELGKTYFGGFISIEPGEIGNIYLEYKLPNYIFSNLGKYELYIQKQPGKELDDLEVDLSFENDIKSYWPAGFYVVQENGQNIKWKTNLNTDKSFEINF